MKKESLKINREIMHFQTFFEGQMTITVNL